MYETFPDLLMNVQKSRNFIYIIAMMLECWHTT